MASFPDDLIPIPSITVAASHDDASMLPATLVSSGIFLSASALALIVSKRPGAVLVTWHGNDAAYAYYSVLFVTVAFGLAEASFGLWVDLRLWNTTAKVLLSVSLLPLALVLALWAGLKL